MREAIRTGSWLTQERIRAYALMLGVMGIIALGINWSTGTTPLTDRLGKPIATDFSAFWTAGRMLLGGDFVGMFDPAIHFDFQSDIFGDPWVEHYGWHYPPPFLAVAGLMAIFPYVISLLIWQGVTFTLFMRTILAIVPKHPLVAIATFGFPAVFLTMGHGHNAFLTSALLGTGLLLMERRPILAGICFGLLSYKPQFALVVPLVVCLGGHWRVAQAAAATVATMVVLSLLAFGPEAWTAFFKGAVFTRHVVLEQGGTGWYKIQSVFSAIRSFGGSIATAYAVQAAVSMSALLALATMVLAGCDRRLVAAATATATMLATPYCLDYDMTILGVAIAFTLAHAADDGFQPYEKSLLALVWLIPFIARSAMMLTGVPIGLLVMIAFFAFLVRRALSAVSFKVPKLWSVARG